MNAVYLLLAAMEVMFGPLGIVPVADGQIHRFHVPSDRAGSRNGWYVLHLDGIARGAFGSWKTGLSSTWSSRKPANHQETQLIVQHIEQVRRQRQSKQHDRHEATAVKASRMMAAAEPADPGHPYLVSKCCQPHSLRQLEDVLLVPLYLDRRLVNLQRIEPNGEKRFLSGGRVIGCYSPIGRPQPGQPIYICEGWATGATLHEHSSVAVACAMHAGNLLPVGERLRLVYPDNPLIVAGDDDRQTPGNPGRTAAERAARTLGCRYVLPAWPEDAPLHLSDFNDLQGWQEANQ